VSSDRSVIVAGAGALGNAVVQALGLLAVPKVVIVDPDRIEERNLTTSILFRVQESLGRNKAVVLAEVAARLFPHTEFRALDREIADVGFGVLADADLLFGCLDNELARLEMAYIATKLDLPVCDGGLGAPDHWHGRVTWFPGRAGPCFGCRLTASKRRELLALWDSPPYPCWGAPEQPPVRPSTPTMAAMVGALQVEIALRALPNRDAQLSRDRQGADAASIEIHFDPSPSLRRIALARSESCPFHLPEEHLVEAADLRVTDLLEQAADLAAGEPALLLDWPVCVQAVCLECRKKWHPMRRLGWLRRRGVCPGCGSRRVREEETLTRVARDSVWATATFAELGLPDRHLHTVRFEAAS
jgi:molybdopterin/thiamine biosynthesis adenylyltransferase